MQKKNIFKISSEHPHLSGLSFKKNPGEGFFFL